MRIEHLKIIWSQETRNLKSIIDHIIVKMTTTISIRDVRVKRGTEQGLEHCLVKAYMHFPWFGVTDEKT